MALTGTYVSENELNDEDIFEEEHVATYKIMHTKWEKAYLIV